MALNSPHIRPKRLVVLCDGTWCGRETGTDSNIEKLADMIGAIDLTTRAGDSPTKVHSIRHTHDGVTAGYQEGIGLNKTFLEYLWDGSTASTIAKECTSVYQFIVENYTDEHEIWLFGLSRGAFTVRCVAGMINNCGIIRARPNPSETSILCQEVYKIYRSPYAIDQPWSPHSRAFKSNAEAVWQVTTPIKFMGLFDTVGSLGIPRLNAGVGFDWPEFYDQKISSEVEKVYHAVSLHDRLWMFEPCLALRDPETAAGNHALEIHQKWFPGCHYDLGRQAFRFVRQAPQNAVEKMLGALPDKLAHTIYPNEVLSDLVLRWMLEAIQLHDHDNLLIHDIQTKINEATARIAFPESTQPLGPTGSGDVYGNILPYTPAGDVWTTLSHLGAKVTGMLDRAVPQLGENIQDLLGVKTILEILLATRDRRIPGGEADVYRYQDLEVFNVGDVVEEESVGKLAKVGRLYPSRTFESFLLWRSVHGDQ